MVWVTSTEKMNSADGAIHCRSGGVPAADEPVDCEDTVATTASERACRVSGLPDILVEPATP